MRLLLIVGALLVASCDVSTMDDAIVASDTADRPTTYRYTEPHQSGLDALRPFPSAGDVCQLVAKNDLVAPFMQSGEMLIACPKHELGALTDRQNDGARVVANTRHWVVLEL